MNYFQDRRKRLMEQVPNASVAIFYSGNAIMKSEDASYPFEVNRNFYYLTGLDAEGMILMMTKIQDRVLEKIFILPYDEQLARWVGGRKKEEEVQETSGIQFVFDVADFDTHFSSLYNQARAFNELNLYLDLWHYDMHQAASPASLFAQKVQHTYPAITVKDIYPMITQMRLIKDDYEISCMSHAISLTKAGIEAMMKTIRPNQNEMMMEGIFNFTLMRNVCHEHAFDTIAASGKRATVLHYHENNQTMLDGELFLCDLGAAHLHHCADISRTFPVNGKFSERQKEIYNVVLNVQKLVEQNAKPGITLRELNQMVIDYYKEELPKIGLMEDVSEYYFHSIGHHLGLDTHDVGSSLGSCLKKGMVITNEPGLYIEKEGIGIRIEDDLLITDDGCINLSKDIIKEIDEIEAFMKA